MPFEFEEEGLTRKAIHELIKRERRDRFKIKDADDIKVREDVFDVRTLLTIYSLMNKGFIDVLKGVVKTGKEARVYWATSKYGDVAVKIYYTVTSQFRKRLAYIEGDPRFASIKKTPHGLTEVWARKEFVNLKQAYEAGIPVPRPITVKSNVLIMEFIGSKGRPAPLLVECEVNREDYETIISYIRKLWADASLVHADLSEYNVFKWEGKLILLDFGSAVDKDHPNALEFLARDINSVNRFFRDRGVETRRTDEILEEVIYA